MKIQNSNVSCEVYDGSSPLNKMLSCHTLLLVPLQRQVFTGPQGESTKSELVARWIIAIMIYRRAWRISFFTQLARATTTCRLQLTKVMVQGTKKALRKTTRRRRLVTEFHVVRSGNTKWNEGNRKAMEGSACLIYTFV
jgi:hypothetical protein